MRFSLPSPVLRILPALLLTALAGCGEPLGPARSVILVTLDTTRADRLAGYGRPDVRTPTLDAWARSGALAATAVADVPLTLPSHVTLFTGMPALYHGVRTNGDFRLGDAAVTLAETFGQAGWETSAVV
ncbi:MAG: sulfatase-like hydrolase/transferase, partial [Gemmatimonadetes bacterium]|nr:sulfatase-like hydrolase/transferase [Gemmatimonadota bacterium]